MNAVSPRILAPLACSRSAAGDLPHPDHPLVVHVREATRGGASDLPAAGLAALAQVTVDGLLVEPQIDALDVFARTEIAAEAAAAALRDVPGRLFQVLGPEVRYGAGPPSCEPVMTVEARMPLMFGAFVRRELLRRRGFVHAMEPGRASVTLRADVPLAALLGFGRWLDALTDRRAELRALLSHYAPLRPYGGPGSEPRAA